MKLKRHNFLLLLIGCLPFIFWLLKYVNADLWYDEISTFENFIFVDFGFPLTHYPYPNNHVFYSLLTQCLAVLSNCRDFHTLFSHVYVFRIFQAALALITVYYSYRLLKKFFTLKHNTLVLVLLFTTIPFMNFSLQLRGYNMSSTLLIMLLFYLWSYLNKPQLWNGVFILLLSTLLLYTIPSNLYALVSILIYLGLIWIFHKRKKQAASLNYFISILFICIGIILSLLLYLPIIKDVIFNDFSIKRPESIWYSLELIPRLLVAFLSKRWILLIFLFIGIWQFLKVAEKLQKERLFALIGILILPFILSFIHQRFPFDRVFVLLAPLFCVILTISIDHCLSLIKKPLSQIIIAYLISIYCIGTFYLEIVANDKAVKTDLENAQLTQNIYENYFLSNAFRPSETADFIHSVKDYDTLIKYNQLDFPSVNWYLQVKGIEFTQANSIVELDSLASTVNRVLVITSYKKQLLEELKQHSQLDVRVVNEKRYFTSVIELRQKK